MIASKWARPTISCFNPFTSANECTVYLTVICLVQMSVQYT